MTNLGDRHHAKTIWRKGDKVQSQRLDPGPKVYKAYHAQRKIPGKRLLRQVFIGIKNTVFGLLRLGFEHLKIGSIAIIAIMIFMAFDHDGREVLRGLRNLISLLINP